MEEKLLEKAKSIIDQFIIDEYDAAGADYDDLSEIGVAYTETEIGEYPVQATVDLINFSITTKVLDLVVNHMTYKDLEDLIDNGLSCLDFDELTYVSDEIIEKLERENKNDL